MLTKQTQSSNSPISRSTITATLGVLVWLWLTLLPVREADGQGTIFFNSRISNAPANQTGHIWGPSTTMPFSSFIGLGSNDSPSGTTPFGSASGMALIGADGPTGNGSTVMGYRTTCAQLIGAVGQNMPESALVPLAGVTTFRTGSSLGCVASINSTFNNPASVDAPWATVEIVAWDNSSGQFPTWTEASVGWMSGRIRAGNSAPINVANIGGTMNVPPCLTSAGAIINGLSFNLYGDCRDCTLLVATTVAATAVTTTSATLNGTVTPNGQPTTAWFEWGNGKLTAATNMGSGTGTLPFSAPLVGLTPNTTYHFRAMAQNPAWSVCGSAQSFTTPMPQTVATLPATDIAATSATLNGTVNPNGWPTAAWFQWGTTTNYGNLTSVTNLGSGTNALPVAAALAGLTPSTTYHFRAAASIGAGVVYGRDQSFDSALPTLIIKTGSGYWNATNSTLSYSYKEGASTGGTPHSFILLQSADMAAPLSAWTRIATNDSIPGSFPIPPVGTAGPTYYRVKSEQRSASALTPMVIHTGRGYWDTASSSLSYDGGGSVDGSPRSFVLLRSADATAPLSAWTRVATNNSTPGSFPIPPVGTAAPTSYRVKSE